MAAMEDGDEERTLIEILEPSSSPIDISRYVNYIRDPTCGAIATFEGTTRVTFNTKHVLELQYEAYVPMATRRLRSICNAARSSWNLHLIAVAHRLGTVPVGESIVFIVLSSVHRDEALEPCSHVIDEVKASVPIWKKEVYANGEVWTENSEFLERMRKGVGFGGAAGHDKNKSPCCGSKVKVVGDEWMAHDSEDHRPSGSEE